MKQLALALSPEPAPGFDNFVVTAAANAAAVEHLRALQPGAPPTYLWSPAGSGKTHLLRALAARLPAGEAACWFDSGSSAGAAPALAPAGQSHSPLLLLFDDCHRYDAAQQHAAFTLFVEAAGAGSAIVAAGRVPPVDLPLRDDLRTRLGWGLVFALEPLGEPEVRAVLRREAARRGIGLSDELLDHLLTRFARDLGHLMALLDRLDDFALASKRAITVPLLRQMLNEEMG